MGFEFGQYFLGFFDKNFFDLGVDFIVSLSAVQLGRVYIKFNFNTDISLGELNVKTQLFHRLCR